MSTFECSNCGLEKPTVEFSIGRKECKPCRNKKHRIDRSKTPEQRQKDEDETKEKKILNYEILKRKAIRKKNEKYDCVCGATYRKADRTRHEESKRHQVFIKEKPTRGYNIFYKNENNEVKSILLTKYQFKKFDKLDTDSFCSLKKCNFI